MIKFIKGFFLKNKYNCFLYLILILCLMFPYIFLRYKAQVIDTIFLTSYLKFLIGGVFPPLIFLICFNLFSNKIYRYFMIFIYNSIYFSVILSILIYFKYFKIIPYYNSIYQTNNLPVIMHQIIFQLIGIEELFIFMLFIISIIISIFLIKSRLFNRTIALILLIIAVVTLITIPIIRMKYKEKRSFDLVALHIKIDPVNSFTLYGFWPFYTIQIIEDLKRKNTSRYQEIKNCPKLNQSNFRKKNFNFKNHNIIFVQVEGLDNRIIDLKVNNEYIMPFLHYFKQNSVYFSHIYHLNGGGNTSDSELSILTGLIPLKNHSAIMTANYKKIKALNSLLAEHNYSSAIFHAYSGTFWNRNWFFKTIGIDKFYEQNSYTGLARGWFSKDLPFFEQSLPRIKNMTQPFFAFLITLQSHGPFGNHDKTKLNLKSIKNPLLVNYCISMNEVDTALAFFVKELEKEKLLDNTIIFIFGDHSSYIEDKLLKTDAINKVSIPLFIYNKKLKPAIINKIGSTIDFAPTTLDLLAIPEPKNVWMGTSLFYEGEGKVLFQNLSVIERKNQKLIYKKDLTLQPYLDYCFYILDFYKIPGV